MIAPGNPSEQHPARAENTVAPVPSHMAKGTGSVFGRVAVLATAIAP